MTQHLTIVGASVRAAACSAARAGYAVRAGDLFADVDLAGVSHATRVATYPAGLAAIVHEAQSGGWMYTGALENYPALVRRMARHRPLWGNPAEVLVRVRRPQCVLDALRSAGLQGPDVMAARDDVPRDGTWLRKPLRSAGGAGISVIHPATDFQSGKPGNYFFQRFVDGAAYSAVFVAAGGKAALLGVTRQLIGAAWTGAGGFRYCGSIGPLPLSAAILRDFDKIGSVLASRFDLVGLFGVDAIVNAEGVWPVEVNPRYTASAELLDRFHGVATAAIHVAACEAGELPGSLPSPPRARVCGKAVVFADSPTVVSADAARQVTGGLHDWPGLADIPPAGTRVAAGQPILTVMAEAADEQQVLEELRRQVAEIKAALSR